MAYHAKDNRRARSLFRRMWKSTPITYRTLLPMDHQDGLNDAKHAKTSVDADENRSKRQQQIYEAQKRHRSKKHEYVRQLESELEQLRSSQSVVAAQKDSLIRENQQMRELIEEHLSEGPGQEPDSSTTMPFAQVGVWYDTDIGHERLFLERDNTGQDEQPSSLLPRDSTWLAVDFILALEWPCRTHIRHPILSSAGVADPLCGDGDFEGHSLTITSRLAGGSLNEDRLRQESLLPHACAEQTMLHKWHIPYAAVERLVELAEQLNLNATVLTPAQAYAAIKAACPSSLALQPVLAKMKMLLVDTATCQGFGTVLDASYFRHMLAGVLVELGQDGRAC